MADFKFESGRWSSEIVLFLLTIALNIRSRIKFAIAPLINYKTCTLRRLYVGNIYINVNIRSLNFLISPLLYLVVSTDNEGKPRGSGSMN